MKPIEVGKGPLGNGERKKGKEGTKSDDSFPQRGKSLKDGFGEYFRGRGEWEFDEIPVGTRRRKTGIKPSEDGEPKILTKVFR